MSTCEPGCVCSKIKALARREWLESLASIKLFKKVMEEKSKQETTGDSVLDTLTPDALRKHLGFPPSPPTSNYDLILLQQRIDEEFRKRRTEYWRGEDVS